MDLKDCGGALLIFARAPREGHVKSRLARAIGNAHATSLYRAMLRDTLALAHEVATHSDLLPIVAFTPDDAFAAAPSLGEFWTGARVAQEAGDLGHKMSAATDWAFAHGAKSVFLIGTDAPDLPAHFIKSAVTSLHHCDAVTIPARDGGFVLWAARHPLHNVFSGVDWTRPNTLASVLENATKVQWKVRQSEAWSDVDEVDDVRALWARLQNAESVAPDTARWLGENWKVLDGGR